MRLHLPSLAIGLVACVATFMLMSQALPGSNSPRIEYGPHPRDMVQIKEGTPYLVPANHMFVLTGLGTNLSSWPTYGNALLKVNGQIEVSGGSVVVTQGGGGLSMEMSTSVGPAPVGFTVPAGSVIEVDDQYAAEQHARAWGYLAK